jgi:hypothetical protein
MLNTIPINRQTNLPLPMSGGPIDVTSRQDVHSSLFNEEDVSEDMLYYETTPNYYQRIKGQMLMAYGHTPGGNEGSDANLKYKEGIAKHLEGGSYG